MNKKIILLIILLFTGCASNNIKTCKNHGAIDFIYINIPCEKCADLIATIFDNNIDIFNYDILHNKENYIIINYCYNYKKTTPDKIEKIIADNNFSINKRMTIEQDIYLQSLCCEK